jgi:murein L,D-transpeptidase YcbB/YkuD
MLLSSELLRYARDLRQGRMAPAAVYPEPALDRQPFQPRRVLQGTADAVETATLPDHLRQLTPGNAMYHRLRRALSEYRLIADAGGWPAPPESPPLLGPGTHHPAVTQLREYLWASGDLSIRKSDSHAFDTGLALALERYQRRHGLPADGIYGPATRRAMAIPVEDRIRQIEVNMERWRWMPDDMGERHILVNLAGFEVEVVESGSTVMRMRAVVGRPYRQTPVFSDRISYLDFNPTWTVPPTIMREDLLPKLRRDPGYLEDNNFHLYSDWSADAERLDPYEVDWKALDPDRIPYRFVQQPGPQNALGRVKFMFPNKHHVYLHDTPEQKLFDENGRAFSSGCIRVEQPKELAAYLLGERPGWDRERIDSTLEDGELTRASLPRPVPVHLTYSTAWVGEGGTVHFRPDIYGRDARLRQALASAETLHRAAAWN